MAEVSTQRELQSALSAKESLIQVAAGFSISSQIDITYQVTIESLTSNNIFTLTKDASYFGCLFRISGGSLTFQNIIIDGDKPAHGTGNTDSRSLVCVTGGSLHLAAGSVLQNNNAASQGGAVSLTSLTSSQNILLMDGDAKITGCHSALNGGAICSALGKVTIQDNTEISHNSSLGYGGGLSASGQTSISMTGGRVCHNQSEYGGGFFNHPGSTLSLASGSVYGNHAAVGGGIYNASSSVISVTDFNFLNKDHPNTASYYGRDIYTEGLFDTEGGRQFSNGVYLGKQAASVKIQGSFVSGSLLQLENSEYVTPNTQGIPIVLGEGTASYPLLTQTDAVAFRKPPSGFDGWEIRLSEDRTQVLLAPANYTIRCENLMGASHSNPSCYTVNTPELRLSAPGPLPGCRFLGWFDAPSGGSRVTVIPQGSIQDVTLYARWEAVSSYTVTYHGNESSCPAVHCVPWPLTVEESSCFLISRQQPVRKGYRFLGWNTDPRGNGISYLPGMTISGIQADLNLYAMWKSEVPSV